jgi:hypothetical protein
MPVQFLAYLLRPGSNLAQVAAEPLSTTSSAVGLCHAHALHALSVIPAVQRQPVAIELALGPASASGVSPAGAVYRPRRQSHIRIPGIGRCQNG